MLSQDQGAGLKCNQPSRLQNLGVVVTPPLPYLKKKHFDARGHLAIFNYIL